MYTDIKQVQIIVSLLKQYGISHFVISPGTRHVPLVHAVEIDPFFDCYSVVDERSAGYVALGLAESLDEPVCITCTSATATCNYMPAMQEAYERNIQLVALTADRARMQRFHGENQCINQVDMYKPYCKYSVDVPNIQNEEEEWFTNRCVNEALLELNHHGKGPVQINFLEPLSISTLSTFKDSFIPQCRKINRYDVDNIDWLQLKRVLQSKKRILVIAGQQYDKEDKLLDSLERFNEEYNVAITYDHFANVRSDHFFQSPLFAECMNSDEKKELKPDLIITFGTKFYSFLGTRYRNEGVEHWHINPNGTIYDILHTLTTVFEMLPYVFFDSLCDGVASISDKIYYNLWKSKLQGFDLTVDEFINHFVIKEVLAKLPEDSNIHVSVLNAIRLSNYRKLAPKTIIFGNICADGIDGALSAFLGQASITDKISLLIIGDLSYLYDLNATLYDIPNNVRILLINNQAGSEFHFNIGVERISTLDKHIAAGHHSIFDAISGFSKFKYLHAKDEEELTQCLMNFFVPADKPIFMEVATNADNDGYGLRDFLKKNRRPTKRQIRNKKLGPIVPIAKALLKPFRK